MAAAESEVQASATAANAPRQIEDMRCDDNGQQIRGPDLLTPQLNMPLPQLDRSQYQRYMNRVAVDPASLCRYRDANRSLAPATPDRVVFLGDSITEGWQAAAPSLFAADVVNRGISGQNTSQMLLRFREDVLDLHPRVVHIMAGVNDINTPSGTVLTKSNIASMVELAKAHGVQVILASITPSSHFWAAPDVVPGPQIVALNEWLKHYADSQHLLFVDYYTSMRDDKLGMRPELTNEGLHPNQRGYDLMTPLARAAVRTALAGRKKR